MCHLVHAYVELLAEAEPVGGGFAVVASFVRRFDGPLHRDDVEAGGHDVVAFEGGIASEATSQRDHEPSIDEGVP